MLSFSIWIFFSFMSEYHRHVLIDRSRSWRNSSRLPLLQKKWLRLCLSEKEGRTCKFWLLSLSVYLSIHVIVFIPICLKFLNCDVSFFSVGNLFIFSFFCEIHLHRRQRDIHSAYCQVTTNYELVTNKTERMKVW